MKFPKTVKINNQEIIVFKPNFKKFIGISMNKPKDISLTISIVSHKQSELIVPLLKNLIKFKKSFEKIFITINIPENIKPISDLKSSKLNIYLTNILRVLEKIIIKLSKNVRANIFV